MEKFIEGYNILKNQALEINDFTDTKISGTVTAKEDGRLFARTMHPAIGLYGLNHKDIWQETSHSRKKQDKAKGMETYKLDTRPCYAFKYVGKKAKIVNSTVSDGCEIDGEVNHSVISAGVKISKGARVIDSVIMSNVKIGKNVIIKKAVIGADAIISDGTQIGTVTAENNKHASPLCTNDIVLIEGGAKIHKNDIIPTGSMVEADLS